MKLLNKLLFLTYLWKLNKKGNLSLKEWQKLEIARLRSGIMRGGEK